MLDGAATATSAMMREPYSHDPEVNGILHWSQEELNELILDAHKIGFQVAAHAIGDRAVEMMVNAIEYAMKEHPREDCRHRIEHCSFVPADLMEKIRRLKIVPIPNPVFCYDEGSIYGPYFHERVNHLIPMKSFVDNGIIAAVASDAVSSPENPMLGLYSMVTRKDKGTGEELGEGQCIGLLDAIRAYTYNGAYASFEEDIKGSLEEGKLADMVVLSRPVLDCPPEELPDVKVEMTMIDGKIVYQGVVESYGI